MKKRSLLKSACLEKTDHFDEISIPSEPAYARRPIGGERESKDREMGVFNKHDHLNNGLKKKKKIFIGTSGWHYSHWKGPFYPKDLPEKHFLEHYVQHFSTVELNRTFYSLPKRKVFEDYGATVPRSFLFSVKASRYITHNKKLKDPKLPLRRFFHAVTGLKKHLGPILFQLPPHWKANPERLETFLKALPKRYRYAFELRDPRWLTDEIYLLLKRYRAALCIYDFEGSASPKILTAPFVYIRLHGPKSAAYQGRYSMAALKKWAAWIRKQECDVYCYFDNDQAGYAALNALELAKLLNRRPFSPMIFPNEKNPPY